jgi:hypothetical protein
MKTAVPPADGPLAGATTDTVGSAAGVNVNWSLIVIGLVPSGDTTLTSTVPVGPAGALTVRNVSPKEEMPKNCPHVEPKSTASKSDSPVPVR